MSSKHTRATPANQPRSRSRMTRAQRKELRRYRPRILIEAADGTLRAPTKHDVIPAMPLNEPIRVRNYAATYDPDWRVVTSCR